MWVLVVGSVGAVRNGGGRCRWMENGWSGGCDDEEAGG